MTQFQLAELVGTREIEISRIETGRTRPDEERTRRICGPEPTRAPRSWQQGLARIVGRIGLGPASRRRRAAQRMLVVRALATLAAELEAGQPPREALHRAAGDPPAWPRALASLRFDGDVAAALDADADDRPVLAPLAACRRIPSVS